MERHEIKDPTIKEMTESRPETFQDGSWRCDCGRILGSGSVGALVVTRKSLEKTLHASGCSSK